MQKSGNVSFDESNFYFEKNIEGDEEEKVGDESFFGELVQKITKNAKNAFTDQDCRKAMQKTFDSSDKNKV